MPALRFLLLSAPWIWAAAALFPPLNHDAAAILHWAQRMWAGERLYIDLWEVNPPLAFWLALIPAGLARLLDAPAGPLAAAATSLLVLLSLTLTAAIGRAAGWRADRRYALALGGAAALLILPAHSFGQREHLLAIVCLPYAVAAAVRAERRMIGLGWLAAAGALAAVGVALKPHFLAVPALVELGLIWRIGFARMIVSPTPWALAFVGLAYVALAAVIHPAYFTALPALIDGYAAPHAGLSGLLIGGHFPALAGAALLLSLAADRDGAVSRALIMAGVGAALAAAAQGRGWDYHYLAARCLLCAAAAPILLERAHNLGARSVAAFACAAIIWTAPPADPFARFADQSDQPALILAQRIRADAPQGRTLWLGVGTAPTYPAVIAARAWTVGPIMNSWMLEGAYAHDQADASGALVPHAPDAQAPLEAAARAAILAALTDPTRAPELLFVATPGSEPGFPGRFDYLAWLREDPAGPAALARYLPAGVTAGWRTFKRRPD